MKLTLFVVQTVCLFALGGCAAVLWTHGARPIAALAVALAIGAAVLCWFNLTAGTP